MSELIEYLEEPVKKHRCTGEYRGELTSTLTKEQEADSSVTFGSVLFLFGAVLPVRFLLAGSLVRFSGSAVRFLGQFRFRRFRFHKAVPPVRFRSRPVKRFQVRFPHFLKTGHVRFLDVSWSTIQLPRDPLESQTMSIL